MKQSYTKQTHVMLVDENRQAAEEWKARLEAMRLGRSTGAKRLRIEIFEMDALKDCIAKLNRRRERARSGKPAEEEENPIDKIEIFVIDYDLLGDGGSIGHTGEELAYLVRCYSACKVIVAVNQGTTDNVFDLNLTGRPESFADVNITGPQIDNPGLWHSPWINEFRPWYWPVLTDLVGKFDRRVDFVREHLDKPLLGALRFDAELWRLLPRKVEAFLCRQGDVGAITFRDFVLASGNGLRPKDKLTEDPKGQQSMCRIGAARISRWLEDLVLAGQEILIDAPHLVARHPGFLKGKDGNSLRAWNKLAQIPLGDPSEGVEKDLGLDERLNSHALNPIWASRPAWFWPKIMADEMLLGSRDRISPGWVFCEDTSRFVNRDLARQFVADVESPHIRRYVTRISNVTYSPEVRLSM